jgi:DNA-binding XRE family transcriptional regulator
MGEKRKNSNALIIISTLLACSRRLIQFIHVFPLIEKHGHFCYSEKWMKLFSLPKDKAKKPARRKLAKEDVLLAARITQLRKARGLTQEELSDILGMNTLYITQVEAKQQGVSLPMVYRIAKVLNVPLRELFSF